MCNTRHTYIHKVHRYQELWQFLQVDHNYHDHGRRVPCERSLKQAYIPNSTYPRHNHNTKTKGEIEAEMNGANIPDNQQAIQDP